MNYFEFCDRKYAFYPIGYHTQSYKTLIINLLYILSVFSKKTDKCEYDK